MAADRLINALVLVTLVELMITTGLGIAWRDLIGVARDWRLLLRTAAANYGFVPAVTVGLLLIIEPNPMVAAGFLILALCPGAPYIPLLTGIAKGNVAVATGLMALLASSSAVVAPLALGPLLRLVTGAEASGVDPAKIVTTLLLTQLLPLCVGMAIGRAKPESARRIRPTAERLSKGLTLATVGVILIVPFEMGTKDMGAGGGPRWHSLR
ncbi:bile acid:sodium symporter family protein [Candidatus Laterigemmans baculatus]|uniref:bile acid:sodium symporter family protein n=1 Tax=Candidatus Laterigemmans baculatus TaxID=2770505 RepID=UPI0013DC80C9|nr:bile acid:sodium symporter [Candidatus Laterigemmans baculatus]